MKKILRESGKHASGCEPGTIFTSLLLILTVLIGIGYLLFAPKQAFSQEENRSLEKAPVLNADNLLDGSFMTGAENYVGDHFMLRRQFIELNTAAQLAIGRRDVASNYGTKPAEGGVYFGKEGHLYEVLLPNKTEFFENNAKALRYFADKSGLPFYVLPVPSGSQVQPENLPVSAPNHDQREELRRLQESAGPNTKVLDVFDRLSLAGGEDFYYKTDHHWNTYGAYEGYAALMEAMDMEPLPKEAFHFQPLEEPFYGTLYSKALAAWQAADTIYLPVARDPVKLTQQTGEQSREGIYWEEFYHKKDKYSAFLGGNHSVDIVRNPKATGGNLLIIKDSYANSMIPFLAMHFSEIHIIDLRHYNRNIYEYMEENKIERAAAIYSIKQLCDVSISGKLTRK